MHDASFPFDVTIVFNVHDETQYLRRTLMSIEEAVRYAKRSGLTFEIVTVLDRSAPSTKAWIDRYDFSAFDAHENMCVDNGSLGPSRNDGTRIAKGNYICLCDADDLISYNYLAECHSLARSRGPKTIVVPQYLFAFGDQFHLWEYFGTSEVSKLAFFSHHPYTSSIFGHFSLFRKLFYVDTRQSNGFAYEDWHLNNTAVAHGYEFASATHDPLLSTTPE